jgi:DNA-binding XRE family transcriptional regulator
MSRQTEAARLRAQGLTLEAIGQQLGISRQGVHQHLRTGIRSRCSKCGREISLRYTRREHRLALCADCLPSDAHFGQRLKVLRLAAGMTQIELAKKAGVGHSALVQYELGNELPRWDNLVKLIRVFGVRLVDVG